MQSASVCILFCSILVCSNYHSSASADTAKPTPLILEKSEGERRVWRPSRVQRAGWANRLRSF